MDFGVSADHSIQLKEIEKQNKYMVFAWELNKLWDMEVAVIPIVIGTVAKRFVQRLEDMEIRGRVETIQTTALLRSARILKRVLETWGHLLSLQLQWEPIG